MSDPITNSVVLPAGSYDYDTLLKATNTAARGAKGKYAENLEAALADASTSAHDTSGTLGHAPGYKIVAIENKDLGVTENVEVFDAGAAEKAADDGTGAIPDPTPKSKPTAKTASANQE